MRRLGLAAIPQQEQPQNQQHKAAEADRINPLSSLIPWLAGISTPSNASESADTKPSRYLVAKGLPTLPMKVVEKAWNLEFVEMEELLPSPRSLRLAEQGVPPASLQDSLIGALSQFQALQQHKSQRRVTDIVTWIRCFSLYIAVLGKKEPNMVPSMVAHMHTVLRLHQRAAHQLAWLEYDIQFRMELAASPDKTWTSGDPWQYVSCLPGQRLSSDPFDLSESEGMGPPKSKGKRPLEQEGELSNPKLATKRAKKGVCRLFNSAPKGCPYGKECIFAHRCSSCGQPDDHGRLSCPSLVGPSTGHHPVGPYSMERSSTPLPRR